MFHNKKSKSKNNYKSALQIILSIITAFVGYFMVSNPHRMVSAIARKYTKYHYDNNQLIKRYFLSPYPLPRIWRRLALARDMYFIGFNALFANKVKLMHKPTYQKIYRSIVKKRFNTNNPYIVAGNHFSSFYPRNLGFFYRKALEPSISVDIKDYSNRLVCYIQSISFALEFFKDIPLTTTIIPVWRNHFLPQKIFTDPADTLPSLLLAIDFLVHPDNYFKPILETDYLTAQQLATTEAEHILSHYRSVLATKTLELANTINPLTGLVDENLSLSGIRDCLVRRSSFYENICVWKSINLALDMGIIDLEELEQDQQPEVLKATIRSNFFRNNIIYHDCTEQTELLDNVCADFLVGHSLGFWSFENIEDLNYIKNFVDMILIDTANNCSLMSPLGMYYSKHNPNGALLYLKVFAPDYMGRTIWSHWSTEFCILLKDLAVATGDSYYFDVAQTIIDNTMLKILQYKGYPELYDSKLQAYQTTFYKSIIDTGWIVNFEWTRQYLC